MTFIIKLLVIIILIAVLITQLNIIIKFDEAADHVITVHKSTHLAKRSLQWDLDSLSKEIDIAKMILGNHMEYHPGEDYTHPDTLPKERTNGK